MKEETQKILKMVADGKLTTIEAEGLLAALSGGGSGSTASEAERNVVKPKYLRVQVDGSSKSGKSEKVQIKIPLGLLRAGVKLAGLLPASVQEKIRGKMEVNGVDFDLGKLRGAEMESLIDSLAETAIEIDGDDEKVRIFCE